jgi:diacylglycerol kinase family enzyme
MTFADEGRSSPDEQNWVGIAANSSSGLGRGAQLVHQLVEELERLGLGSEIAWTPEERCALVGRASTDNGCRSLVAVGGDGTVSALINERPRVPISVLPSGTENLFAGHFGFSRNPAALAGAIARGQSVPVDVGQSLGRWFVLMGGFGFDADVVTRHHQSRVSRVGAVRPTHRIAYVEPIVRSSLFYRFPRITVRVADAGAEESLVGTTVLVFNLPRYALGLPFAPEAREDDGWLNLVVFRKPGPFHALFYLWRVFCRSHLRDPTVFHRRVKKVVVTAQDQVPAQFDGDPAGVVLPDDSLAACNGDVESDGGSRAHREYPSARSHAGAVTQSAAEWTVELLPAALRVVAVTERPGGAESVSARQRPARAIG